MQIALTGPIPTRDLSSNLYPDSVALAQTYQGCGGTPVALLAEEYLRRGHEVTIFSLDPKVIHEVVLRGPKLTIFLGPNGRRWQYDFHRVERSYLRQAMLRVQPELIHAHWTYQFSKAALDTGIPTVVTAHDAPWKIHTFQKWRAKPYWLMRALLASQVARHTCSLTTVSPYMASYWRTAMRYSRDIAIVPNGLPEAAFHPPRQGARPQRPFTMATIMSGGWDGLKNGAVAVKAFSLLRRELPDCRYIFLGTGTGHGESMQRWASSLGLEHGIEFRGTVPHASILNTLATEVDVLLHSSIEESFGMTLIEAMAAGVPVVAGKDTGGPPWILDEGKAGVLVDVRRPDAIAQALCEVAVNQERRDQIGRAGYARARALFSIASVATSYLRLYAELTEQIGAER